MITFEIIKFILFSMAIATISLTITKAVIFERLRELITNKTIIFGKLLNCPYCFAHWISFIISFFFNQEYPIAFNIIYSLALVCGSSIFMGLIYNSISKIQNN